MAGGRHEPQVRDGVIGAVEGIERVGKEWGRVGQGVALPRSAPGLSCSRAPASKGWGCGPSVVFSAILFASAASCSSLPAAQGVLHRYAYISVSVETGSSSFIAPGVIAHCLPSIKITGNCSV
jgi:hypothetical protein